MSRDRFLSWPRRSRSDPARRPSFRPNTPPLSIRRLRERYTPPNWAGSGAFELRFPSAGRLESHARPELRSYLRRQQGPLRSSVRAALGSSRRAKLHEERCLIGLNPYLKNRRSRPHPLPPADSRRAARSGCSGDGPRRRQACAVDASRRLGRIAGRLRHSCPRPVAAAGCG